jgi:hypothetical protein
MKLQRVQNKVLRTIGNLPWRTLVRDLHWRSKFRMYNEIMQATSRIRTKYDNENGRNIGQGEPRH